MNLNHPCSTALNENARKKQKNKNKNKKQKNKKQKTKKKTTIHHLLNFTRLVVASNQV
jgi:hypothetical protein